MQALFDWGRSLPPAGLYAFIFLWLFVESTGFPLSDEPLLLLGGTLIFQQRLALLPTIGLALGGKVLASCCAYWIGQRLDLERLARPAQRPAGGWQRWLYLLRPTPAVVLTVKERFRRQGVWGVFLGRLLPVVRSFISYPAGAARMPFPAFLLATTAGSALWIIGWTLLGILLGRSAQVVLARWSALSWMIVGALILLIAAAWLWTHRRATREAARQAAESGAGQRKPDLEPESGSTPHA